MFKKFIFMYPGDYKYFCGEALKPPFPVKEEG
jgi:hypothetical protein